MSEHNLRTLNMYRSGGADEYIEHKKVDPETEKWERLFNYVTSQIEEDKSKKIVEFGSGCGQLAYSLQEAGYDITASDTVEQFLNDEKNTGVKNIVEFNFLDDEYDKVFDSKADLIIAWRIPHLDNDDMKKLFNVAYNALNDDGLFIINFQNADVHKDAEVLPNGTKYQYLILEDKPTKDQRFYAFYSEEDIDNLREGLFDINEHHTEGGAEKKNWHVLSLRKIKK